MEEERTWKDKLIEWIIVLVVRPVAWFEEKFPGESAKRDRKIVDELIRAKEDDDNRIRSEMSLQIDHLPKDAQRQFSDLGLNPLKLFAALQSTSLLIKRYLRHSGYTIIDYMDEYGNISFENGDGLIPATTTIQEMYQYARVDSATAKKLLLWVCGAAVYWRKIIPGFEIKTANLINGEFRLGLEAEKKQQTPQ